MRPLLGDGSSCQGEVASPVCGKTGWVEWVACFTYQTPRRQSGCLGTCKQCILSHVAMRSFPSDYEGRISSAPKRSYWSLVQLPPTFRSRRLEPAPSNKSWTFGSLCRHLAFAQNYCFTTPSPFPLLLCGTFPLASVKCTCSVVPLLASVSVWVLPFIHACNRCNLESDWLSCCSK